MREAYLNDHPEILGWLGDAGVNEGYWDVFQRIRARR
jgi:hypothetical protein